MTEIRKLYCLLTLGVPLSYFFCEDEVSAELAVNLNKLSQIDKQKVLDITTQLVAKSNEDNV
ncbi:hypothetical protein [Vibrio anguillarum]|uniref:hypothetical protein n=1 Tax=Vibrio anguillarum TaxID=55601 RepID=UPI002E19C8F8